MAASAAAPPPPEAEVEEEDSSFSGLTFFILNLGFWILDFGFWILDFGFLDLKGRGQAYRLAVSESIGRAASALFTGKICSDLS